jgi:Lon protease-like protein
MANMVLFPGTVLPLCAVEPWLVDLLDEAYVTNGALAVALVRTGGNGSPIPAMHDVACAGRLVHHERSDAGCNVLVHGLARVRLQSEVPAGRDYPCFRAEACVCLHERLDDAMLARLRSSVLSLCDAVATTDHELVEVLSCTADPVALTDILAAVLVSDPLARQALLSACDFRVRVQLLLDKIAEMILRLGGPPVSAN